MTKGQRLLASRYPDTSTPVGVHWLLIDSTPQHATSVTGAELHNPFTLSPLPLESIKSPCYSETQRAH